MAGVRYIPRKTRVKTEFLKGVTGLDMFWIGIGLALTGLVGISNIFPSLFANIIAAVCVGLFFAVGLLKAGDGVRMYSMIWLWFRFFAFAKKYAKITGSGYDNITKIVPYEKIVDDNLIYLGTYYGAVIEIKPIEFGLLDNTKQEIVINAFANSLRRLAAGQNASVIRLERSMVLDKYIDYEIEKYENVVKSVENGSLSEAELEAREVIFNERGLFLEYINEEEKIFQGSFYFVIYDNDKDALNSTANGILGTLSGSSVAMESRRIKGNELAVFLRANYSKDFDERELLELPEDKVMNWIIPNKIKFSAKQFEISSKQGVAKRVGFTITDYPLEVGNAWAYTLFNMPGCRTVMNFFQVGKLEAEKLIDRAIMEMGTQMSNSGKSSHIMDRQTQLETTQSLLAEIKRGNEQMYDVNIHIVAEIEQSKELRARLREEGFKFSECFGRQVDSFVSSNISRVESFNEYARGIPTTTVASGFPFVSDMLQDEKGIYIGSNSYPVFIDFFKRSSIRVNSNMIVIGKSGSGKSFATKSILAHLAADNTKIFVCDPEKEYVRMAENLHGNVIDVGNAGKGRFNPFHVYPAMLDDDDKGAEFDDTFESHLRFLESFFKIVLEGIRSDALETLNGLVVALYTSKGFDKYTDFAKVQPEQFPTFQDLFVLAKQRHQTAADDFSKINFRILVTYLEKFAEGGRYSGLWNGPATIRTNENFVSFNFLTLLSNKNTVVANAQMLLVFKYLDGEIIKNREYNQKTGQKRRIIIVVDEAHVFIDEQKPIALDFMFQMAKRIRKYDGMQIIITQNIKDFVGSPVIAKKSAAIINASQYSMIFSLAPNDMTDLITLYKNAGGINKSEQDQIVGNTLGQCFFITGPMNRTLVTIETSDTLQQVFK